MRECVAELVDFYALADVVCEIVWGGEHAWETAGPKALIQPLRDKIKRLRGAQGEPCNEKAEADNLYLRGRIYELEAALYEILEVEYVIDLAHDIAQAALREKK